VDKGKAEELVDKILAEYLDTIKTSSWMDQLTKETAEVKTLKIKKFIGYHDKLRSEEATSYYDDLPGLSEENFMETGLAFHVFTTDREFRKFHAKKKKGEPVEDDWTK